MLAVVSHSHTVFRYLHSGTMKLLLVLLAFATHTMLVEAILYSLTFRNSVPLVERQELGNVQQSTALPFCWAHVSLEISEFD